MEPPPDCERVLVRDENWMPRLCQALPANLGPSSCTWPAPRALDAVAALGLVPAARVEPVIALLVLDTPHVLTFMRHLPAPLASVPAASPPPPRPPCAP